MENQKALNHPEFRGKYFSERGDIKVYVNGSNYIVYSSDGRVLMENKIEKKIFFDSM